MAFKLKTSKKTEEILTQIESSTNIPYATLIKLSLALSLRKGSLQEEDFKTNNLGRELNRQTITGDADALYKCLFEVCAHRHISDEEYQNITGKKLYKNSIKKYKDDYKYEDYKKIIDYIIQKNNITISKPHRKMDWFIWYKNRQSIIENNK